MRRGRRSVLTEEQVIHARRMRALGAPWKEIIQAVGGNQWAVRRAVHGKTWPHARGPIVRPSRRGRPRLLRDAHAVELVRTMRARGASYVKIAQAVGTTYAVARWAAIGLSWPDAPGPIATVRPRRVPSQHAETAARLRSEGHSCREIATRLGIATSTVSRILRRWAAERGPSPKRAG
jgi:Homeodomain-like domain